jgi:hypothetical protein
MENQNLQWYQKKGGVIVLLVLFFPAGLYLMWKYSNYWPKKTKILITVAVLIFAGIASNNPSKSSTSYSSASNKCLLDGCSLEGEGWFHSSQSAEMRAANLYGVYRVEESGGYCSRAHGEQDN